jgi:hypothetical protein
VRDGSFVKSDLRRSVPGEWYAGAGNRFERVDFSSAELDRINFWQSSLVRCRFAGPVRDVVFDRRMSGEGKAGPQPDA